MLKVEVDKKTIAYARHGKGMPLVLLHGYPLDHSIWEPLVPFLENDFDLILPDLPGFGDSQVMGGNPSMAGYARVIASLMDMLGVPKAALVGHSMGGYVALAFAQDFPERLFGLGLVSSQVLADPPERKTARYAEARQVTEHGVMDVAYGMSVKLTAALNLQTELKDLILQQQPDGLAAASRAMADRMDSSDLVMGFTLPLVLVHGLSDGLIPVERAQSIKAAVAHATLVEIPNCGHMPMLEAPGVTAEALKALK
jgi:3-oxoadipate enol-lactonase